METKKDTDSALKQALERRQTGSLSSNFSFKIMEQIRQEAVRQQKRKECILLISLIVAVVLLVGGVVCYFILFTDFQLSMGAFLSLELPRVSSPIMGFYVYTAALASILLGLDYWLRRKRSI